MSEAHQYKGGESILILSRDDLECVALEARYRGLKFNRVQIHFLSSSVLQDDPERDDCDTYFNLSGRAGDLVRHGFAHPSWLPRRRSWRTSRTCDTAGFGRVWMVTRTRAGYRLQGARYQDSMTKLTSVSPVWPRGAAAPLSASAP
ncbi:MAG: hypothetical protein ABI885_08715 [Gammaproteobacteria bacterium]